VWQLLGSHVFLSGCALACHIPEYSMQGIDGLCSYSVFVLYAVVICTLSSSRLEECFFVLLISCILMSFERLYSGPSNGSCYRLLFSCVDSGCVYDALQVFCNMLYFPGHHVTYPRMHLLWDSAWQLCSFLHFCVCIPIFVVLFP